MYLLHENTVLSKNNVNNNIIALELRGYKFKNLIVSYLAQYYFYNYVKSTLLL